MLSFYEGVCVCVCQWPGQLVMFPGGVSAQSSGSRRTDGYLHHPPAERKTLRALRQGDPPPRYTDSLHHLVVQTGITLAGQCTEVLAAVLYLKI